MALIQAAIIQAGRDILGNASEKAAGERYVPDEAIVPSLQPAIRQLNQAFGSADSRREKIFYTEAGTQDYELEDTVADDVGIITDVIRSAANVDAGFFGEDIDTLNGTNKPAVIPWANQTGVRDLILAEERWRRNDKFAFERVTVAGEGSDADTEYLRLMPCPESVETVLVRYTSDGSTIGTLPDQCATAMTYAVCVAILDAMLNRFNSIFAQVARSAVSGAMAGPADMERFKAIKEQRERYKGLYIEELASIGRS